MVPSVLQMILIDYLRLYVAFNTLAFKPCNILTTMNMQLHGDDAEELGSKLDRPADDAAPAEPIPGAEE